MPMNVFFVFAAFIHVHHDTKIHPIRADLTGGDCSHFVWLLQFSFRPIGSNLGLLPANDRLGGMFPVNERGVELFPSNERRAGLFPAIERRA